MELGSVYPVNRQAQKTLESQKSLLEEIRRGLGGGRNSNPALEGFDVNNKLENPEDRFAYMQNYDRLGDALINRGAELIGEALD